MISKLFTSSKRRRGGSPRRRRLTLNTSLDEDEDPDDVKWTRVFEKSMGKRRFRKFKRSLAKLRSKESFVSFEKDLRMIKIPEREACRPEQVNKDITRDKIVINGIEFKDHTSGTASQGLIKVLRHDLLDIVKSEVVGSKYEPESLVEWILQACTRTSHGADSYFALHTLLSKMQQISQSSNTIERTPVPPRFLITPAKTNASQDSEVFVGTVKGTYPFAFVCNFNDYTIQIRDEMGRKINTFQLRTLISEVLDSEISSNKILRGRRTLTIVTEGRARRHVLQRLCEVVPRRAVQIIKRTQLREAFRIWYWTCQRASFDMNAVEKMRQDLRGHLNRQSKLLQVKKKSVVDLDVERRSIKASNERLRTEVDALRVQIEKARSQNSILNSNLNQILDKQRDLRKTISQLKAVTPRVRRRTSNNAQLTTHNTQSSSPRSRMMNQKDKSIKTKKEVVSCSSYVASQLMRPSNTTRTAAVAAAAAHTITSNTRTKDIATKTRPFEIIFFQMCSSKSMQREDWMKCMRTTSIVPRLVSIQTALLIFEQYAIRNTMRPIEFLHAITRIARVLYTKSGRYRNANESLLKLLAHCIEHGNWSRQTRRLLLRHL
jgi:hypothetical protein